MSDDFIEGDPFDPVDNDRENLDLKKRTEEASHETMRFLISRREAYTRLFAGSATADDAKIVADDLRTFCRGEDTAWADDARVHALLSGRQEVYIRIMDHTRLPFDAMVEKYTKPR